jgi:hypothetical protein
MEQTPQQTTQVATKQDNTPNVMSVDPTEIEIIPIV